MPRWREGCGGHGRNIRERVWHLGWGVGKPMQWAGSGKNASKKSGAFGAHPQPNPSRPLPGKRPKTTFPFGRNHFTPPSVMGGSRPLKRSMLLSIKREGILRGGNSKGKISFAPFSHQLGRCRLLPPSLRVVVYIAKAFYPSPSICLPPL